MTNGHEIKALMQNRLWQLNRVKPNAPPDSDFKRGRAAGYAVAVAGTAAAAFLRWGIEKLVGEIPPFITFYPVALISAAIGGTRPGLLATLLTSMATAYFFIEPRGQLAIAGTNDMVALGIFIIINIAISVLGGRFRRAHRALLAAREELGRANTELERRIEERTARLRETIHELEGFSYSITHDMRAPLRAMQTFATLAEEQCAGCDRHPSHDFFRRIKVAAGRLDDLIQDALNYSKVVRDEFPLTPVDAATLLRGVVETYPNLQSPGADIRIEFDRLVVLGNESALTQIFSNLLGNAVKFVAPGTKPLVRVWARPQEARTPEDANPGNPPAALGTQNPGPVQPSTNPFIPPGTPFVRIWLEDNGIGIPQHAHARIFRMFERMHRTEEYPGTGIGLAIVRKAANRMGGQVGLESDPGKGSRFWIELALASNGYTAPTAKRAA